MSAPAIYWEPKLPETEMQQWAADAENRGIWCPRRAAAMPLVYFPDDHLVEIRYDVEQDWKPPFWFDLVGGSIQSRSWLEWHWQRGVDPDARRKSLPRWLRFLTIERDGYVCQLCKGDVDPDDVHIDHIKPVSKGGLDVLGNLQVTHSLCNLRKAARY